MSRIVTTDEPGRPGRKPVSTDDERTNIGNNLALRRGAMQLSQTDVAAALEMVPSIISMHERVVNVLQNPGEETLPRYARLYRCSVEELKAPPPPVDRLPTVPGVVVKVRWIGREPSLELQRRATAFEEEMTRAVQKERKGKQLPLIQLDGKLRRRAEVSEAAVDRLAAKLEKHHPAEKAPRGSSRSPASVAALPSPKKPRGRSAQKPLR